MKQCGKCIEYREWPEEKDCNKKCPWEEENATMKDPCLWCDGKTAWNGSEWIQMSRCEEEEYCEYYQQYIRQREEEDFWKSELKRGAIAPGIYADDFLEV